MIMISTDVLVIGAGMAGLTLAQKLKHHGKHLVCVDKARGSGGRLSSKRVSNQDVNIGFDLGALSFTANTPEFKTTVNNWVKQECVTDWLHQNDESHYIGVPRNSSLTRLLADEVEVKFDVRISALVKDEQNWNVYREHDGKECLYAQAKQIVFASPAPQTYALLPEQHELKAALQDVTINPQWVVMFALSDALNIPNLWQNPNKNINSISYENSKLGRSQAHGLHVYCVQASHGWSESKLDYSKDKIIYELANELAQLCIEPLVIKYDYAHRWLYAQGSEKGHVNQGFLASNDGIFVCGDYLLAGMQVSGVEAAYLSGKALVEHITGEQRYLREET